MKFLSILCLIYMGLSQIVNAQQSAFSLEDSDRSLQQPTLSKDSNYTDLNVNFSLGRDGTTVTESALSSRASDDPFDSNSPFKHTKDTLNKALEEFEKEEQYLGQSERRQELQNLLVGFIVELLIIGLALQIAFSLRGQSELFSLVAALSLALALLGAGLEYFLGLGLQNPVRAGIGLLVLIPLVRSLKEVQSWNAAIRIALPARLVAYALTWVIFAGAGAVFGL